MRILYNGLSFSLDNIIVRPSDRIKTAFLYIFISMFSEEIKKQNNSLFI